MSTYRAAVMTAPHAPIQVQEVPSPVIADGAALLRVTYSEVCGTDVHLHHGRLSGVPYPIIPGHVSVGEIEEVGGSIRDAEGRRFERGDRVTFLDVHETCGRCYHCLVTKQSTRCPGRKVYGITYSSTEGLLGGWAEALWMKPGVHMLRLPDELDAETFIGGGCGLVTAMHAIDRAEIRMGNTVAVLGVGPVGQSIVALAALSGADRIVAVGDPDARLEFAHRMGATDTLGLSVAAGDRAAAVKDMTHGFGVDAVIEASGAPEAVSEAFDLVRDGGRIVVCGHYTDNGDVRIHPHWQINRKHVELRGCWGSDFSHFHRAIKVAAKHRARVPWRDMVSRAYGLHEANAALAAVARREVTKALIVPSLR
ncbi:MAG: zinc-binding dehydrogenase [Gemmatimonadaceae bacterium]